MLIAYSTLVTALTNTGHLGFQLAFTQYVAWNTSGIGTRNR